MKAAVVYKTNDIGVAREVLNVLNKLGIEPDMYDSPSSSLEKYDFIVSIGGDGTILALLQFLKVCPPIFGVNTGKVGLLTHSNPQNFEEKLKKAIRSFEIEQFPRISCISSENEFLALNEVVLVNEKPAKLMTVKVKIDGILADEIRCDGMIVATQIGSTGYAFSSGGPIIEPYLDSLIVVPIAPFRFGWKPIVIRSDRMVELESSSMGIVVVDGQSYIKTRKVRIQKSSYPAIFFKKENRLDDLFEKIKEIK